MLVDYYNIIQYYDAIRLQEAITLNRVHNVRGNRMTQSRRHCYLRIK